MMIQGKALAKDEFGGVVGLLFREDPKLWLVKFRTSLTTRRSSPDSRQIWRVSGLAPLRRRRRTSIPDFDDEVSTFGGLVTTEFGRIPKQEQVIEFCNLHVRIIEADDKLVQLAESLKTLCKT